MGYVNWTELNEHIVQVNKEEESEVYRNGCCLHPEHKEKLEELLISGCSAAQPPNYWRMRELNFEGDTAIKRIKHQLSDK